MTNLEDCPKGEFHHFIIPPPRETYGTSPVGRCRNCGAERVHTNHLPGGTKEKTMTQTETQHTAGTACMERLVGIERTDSLGRNPLPRWPELREPCAECSGIGLVKKQLYDERPDATVPCQDCNGMGHRVTSDLAVWLDAARSVGDTSVTRDTLDDGRIGSCAEIYVESIEELFEHAVIGPALEAVAGALCLATGGRHEREGDG